MLSIQKLMFLTDFSPAADQAFPLACTLAQACSAELTVFHVVTPPTGVSFAEMRKIMERTDGYRKEVEEKLQRYQRQFSTAQVAYLLHDGDPAAAVKQEAETRHCDLIVMGTHGRSGLRRLLMGSIAEEVLRTAPCPVVTVRS